MLRLLWTLLQLSIVLALVAYLGQFNSPVQIVWGGFIVELSLLTLSIGLSIVFCLLLVVLLAVARLRRIPKNVRNFRLHRRRELGYRALTRGMVAVAAGEKFAAQKAARQAESLLQDPPLTMLLSAQSAQLQGDELAAKKYFTNMLDHPEMAFLGWRGLIMQALREGDNAAAGALIAQAEVRFPKQPWLIAQALEFEEREGNASNALALVHRAQKIGALNRLEATQRETMLLLQQAEENYALSRLSAAKASAQKAWKILQKHFSDDNIKQQDQAARIHLLLADIALQQADQRGAEKALKLSWQYGQGHLNRQMVLERLESIHGADTPLQQWKAARQFFKELALETDVAIWLARLALNADLFGEAEAILQRDPNPENLAHYQLRVVISEQQENDAAVEKWQQKVLNYQA